MLSPRVSLDDLVNLLKVSGLQKDDEFERKMEGFLHHPLFNSVMLYSNQSIRVVEHRSFQYLYVSDNIQNLVGFSANELKEKGVFFTYRRAHPMDFLSFIKVVFKVYKALDKMSREEKLNSCFKFDVRFKCKDNNYKRILQQCYILELDSEGKPAILLFISSDISGIKTRNTLDYELATFYPGRGFEVVLEESSFLSAEIPISLRELEIVKLISQGLTEKEISEKLFLSPHTVKSHRKNILSKTGLKNTADLVREAVARNWIS